MMMLMLMQLHQVHLKTMLYLHRCRCPRLHIHLDRWRQRRWQGVVVPQPACMELRPGQSFLCIHFGSSVLGGSRLMFGEWTYRSQGKHRCTGCCAYLVAYLNEWENVWLIYHWIGFSDFAYTYQIIRTSHLHMKLNINPKSLAEAENIHIYITSFEAEVRSMEVACPTSGWQTASLPLCLSREQ